MERFTESVAGVHGWKMTRHYTEITKVSGVDVLKVTKRNTCTSMKHNSKRLTDEPQQAVKPENTIHWVPGRQETPR